MEIERTHRNQRNPSEVWAEMCNGSTEALGELYDMHIDSLYAYGMKMSSQKETVMDAIHDVFLSLHRYHNKLSTPDNIQAYLFLSLKRELFRKHQTGVIPMYPLDPSMVHSEVLSITGYEDELIALDRERDLSSLLSRALGRLNSHQKKAITMRFQDDMSYEEIAQTLRVSVASARTMIYRTLKALRKGILFLPFFFF